MHLNFLKSLFKKLLKGRWNSDKRSTIAINNSCFIADAQARAFALNHFGHMSLNACSKCKVEGHCSEETLSFRGTTIFPGIQHALRTNQQYRDVVDEDHHKGRSPLEPVIGLVTQVPFEPLHLIYIENVKKILYTYVYGKYGYFFRGKSDFESIEESVRRLSPQNRA